MAPRLNRALQVRTANRLRASLARDEISDLPAVGSLSDDDESELREVGGGQVGAIVFRVGWVIDAARYPRAIDEIHSLVMREVAERIDEQVRRTDLLCWLSEEALVVLAPALDPASARSMADRLSAFFAGRELEVGDLHVQLRVKVGIATRSPASAVGWTTRTLADEAQRNTVDVQPPAIVA